MTNEEVLKILDEISVKDDSWEERFQTAWDNKFWVDKLVPIIIKILRKMRNENISKEYTSLMLELDVNQFQKLISGKDFDISFKTLCLIERFLEIEIIKV